MPPGDSMEKGKGFDNMISCAVKLSQSAPHAVGTITSPDPYCLLMLFASWTAHYFTSN